MRKILLALPMIAGAAWANPAMAQDRDTHFDGPYVSVSIGQAAATNRDGVDPVVFDTNRDGTYGDQVTTTTGFNAFSPGFCPGVASGNAQGNCAGDKNGVEYAARLGYDMRMGDIVIGGLIEGAKPEAMDAASAFSTTPAGYHLAREIDWSASARARLGYTPGGGALFYATGGGSYAKVNHTFSTTNTANSFTSTSDGDMIWGWQAGGGAEIMVAKNFSVGLEYLYNRYDDDKYFVAIGPGTASATNPFLLNGGGTNMRQDTRFEFHSVRATLNLRF